MSTPNDIPHEQAIEFLLELGRDLHQAGTPAHRLEETLAATAVTLGLEAQLFSTPTSLLIAVGPDAQQRTFLLRIEPGDVDLERLSLVDDVAGRVARAQLTPADASRELREIEKRSPRYPRWLSACSFAIASAGAGVFLQGSWSDIGAGGFLGLVVGIITVYLGSRRRFARVLEAIAGILVASGALLIDRHLTPIATSLVTISGLVVLLPGLTLTLAVNELATRNLVSGTARLAYAATILVSIAFGVSVGLQLESTLPPSPEHTGTPVPQWLQWPTLALAALSFTVLFRARPAAFWPIALIGTVGVICAQAGSRALGPELGASAGALAVGISANLWSRLTDRPAAIATLPAIILLVPGSLGFRGVVALAGDETISGIDAVFSAVLVAVSLVVGLLMANVLLPARKTL